eukprot:TRINITY_DN57810_c0_g1_i2.p1 TRINITY_DN57810_c0_g1~~TRINITY_DN57810_c0_g1_i2.p1  ORF type:complete len:134 (+),score=18.29 TRINITY_DN57810_c0_g1_i2:2-403(+)
MPSLVGSEMCIRDRQWDCRIPGKKDSLWANGEFPLVMIFTDDYPGKPPKCKFPEKFYHPNVYPSGTVCLSILNEDEDWKPSITIRDILLGIQDLLNNPNPASPAQEEAFTDFTSNKEEYARKVKQQTERYRRG